VLHLIIGKFGIAGNRCSGLKVVAVVIPSNPGIQLLLVRSGGLWIPAFAGMTVVIVGNCWEQTGGTK